MSASMMQWAWEADADTKPKCVLLALAWACQDGNPTKPGNVCWPAPETLMRRCGIRSKRTLYDHLAWLERNGFITRNAEIGRTEYFLNFGGGKPPKPQPAVSEPEPAAPVRETAQPSLELAPPQCESPHPSAAKIRTDSIEGKKRGKKTISQKTPPSEGQKRVQGTAHRLPDEWTPGEAGHAFAESLGLDPQATFEAFRDHWFASAQPAARKLDWSAAWRNWCRRELAMHPKRFGPSAYDNPVFHTVFDEAEDAAARQRLIEKGLYYVVQPGLEGGP